MHFLDKVRLAFECPLRWEKLAGGDDRRFCGECQRHVHNLSAMTRWQAEVFLAETRAPICVRVEIDRDGRAVHRPALLGLAAAGALVTAAALAEDAPPAAALAPPAPLPAPPAGKALDPEILEQLEALGGYVEPPADPPPAPPPPPEPEMTPEQLEQLIVMGYFE